MGNWPGTEILSKYEPIPFFFSFRYQALSQTFFSLGVGFGGLMTLSSYNKFHTPIWRLCVFNAFVNLFTSLLAGFVIFGSLGYIAYVTGQPIEEVSVVKRSNLQIIYISENWDQTFP
jgi:SNF family Na+-dependent transporter